jgi:hypothetical protein
VAVQDAPVVYPETVNVAGDASDAEAESGVGVPEVQDRLTVTVAPLFGLKSLLTVKVALFWVFVIVQLPVPEGEPVMPPLHVPVDV